MKPLPWSHSALDDFRNCPRAYHEKRVLKSVTQEQTPEMIWGERVHKAFELRQLGDASLPPELEEHEPFMKQLEALPGLYFACEQKIAFDTKCQPVNWQSRDIWCRGIIDHQKVCSVQRYAHLTDYKTGKPHDKFEQLALFALHTFAMHPVDKVKVQFYWTKTLTTTHKIWTREEIPALWAKFIPHLRQYVEAFKTDTWQPRPSGLCHGWCPITSCEHWRPKKMRR